MRIVPRQLAVLSSVVALAACSAITDGDGQQESGIQGGFNDTSAAHNFAVGITNKLGGVCSGTLIAPNLILTARHCVVPPTHAASVTCSDVFQQNVAPSVMAVTTEPNLYRAKSSYAVTEILTPTDKAFCGNDIALIILDRDVPETEAQPAIPVVQFKLTDRRLSGSITAMGYGITSPSAEDSGLRRVRENIPLLCIPGSPVMDCSGDLAKYSDNPAEFVTQGYVCSGDSGSGAFDQKSFARVAPYVLGALSRGPQSADKCLAAIYSRTDAHAQLLIDAATKAAAQGKYALPSWTIPEPPSAASDPSGGPPCERDGCNPVTEAPPAPIPMTTKTSSGCSAGIRAAGGSGTGSGSTALVGLAIAAALAARRRRSS